jgi:O-antigen/teichoic acid export membrane protein
MTASPKQKSLKLNVIFNALYQIFVLIVPFVTSPYISRVLLPTGVGSYSYSFSTVTYFATAAAFGFLDYGTTLIAKNRDDKAKYSQSFWELLGTKAIFTSLIVIIYISLSLGNIFYSASYPLNSKIVFIFLGCDILVNAMDATFLFQGLEDFGPLCLRNFLVRLLNMILIFTCVRSSGDYLNYVIIMSVSNILLGLFTFIGIHKKISKPVKGKFPFFSHIRNSFIFFIPAAAISFFPVISKSFLGLIVRDSAKSGYYEQADKLITLTVTMINSVDAIMMARMSYLYATHNEEQIREKTKETLQLYLLFALPAFFGIIAINPYFTVGFFGSDYEESVQLVYLMAPRILLSPLTGLLGAIYYIPSGKLWKRNIFYLIGFGLNVLLNGLLIYYDSVQGAALATMLTDLVLCLMFVLYARRDVRFPAVKETFIKSLDSALLMFVCAFVIALYFGKKISPIKVSVLQILAGIIVYALFVLLFREEMSTRYFNAFRNKLRKRKGISK